MKTDDSEFQRFQAFVEGLAPEDLPKQTKWVQCCAQHPKTKLIRGLQRTRMRQLVRQGELV